MRDGGGGRSPVAWDKQGAVGVPWEKPVRTQRQIRRPLARNIGCLPRLGAGTKQPVNTFLAGGVGKRRCQRVRRLVPPRKDRTSCAVVLSAPEKSPRALFTNLADGGHRVPTWPLGGRDCQQSGPRSGEGGQEPVSQGFLPFLSAFL